MSDGRSGETDGLRIVARQMRSRMSYDRCTGSHYETVNERIGWRAKPSRPSTAPTRRNGRRTKRLDGSVELGFELALSAILLDKRFDVEA